MLLHLRYTSPGYEHVYALNGVPAPKIQYVHVPMRVSTHIMVLQPPLSTQLTAHGYEIPQSAGAYVTVKLPMVVP